MALPIRSRLVPRCSACTHSYTWASLAEGSPALALGSRQQVRGKKKMVNNAANVTVRLLKDMETFGRAGALVPVSRGLMRNEWFKRRIAEYVISPELQHLRSSGTPMERDHTYGMAADATNGAGPSAMEDALAKPTPPPVKRAPEVQKLTPERSLELLEIFTPHRLDFWRQPIVEEKVEAEQPPAPEPNVEKQRTASSAASDLLEARTRAAPVKAKFTGPQSIYGSVSTHDILVSIRAAIAGNDEAARVIVAEDDIVFGGQYAEEDVDLGKIKKTGDYTIEIKARGLENGIRRTVRVIPQES